MAPMIVKQKGESQGLNFQMPLRGNMSHYEHLTLNFLQAKLILRTTSPGMLSKNILLFFCLIFYIKVGLISGGRN